jgi:uncharacterized protein (DUF2249 family)
LTRLLACFYNHYSKNKRKEIAMAQVSLSGTELTLTDEHALLLSQVTARAGYVLTALGNGRQPIAELDALASYARAEVLRQARDEEALMFRAATAQEASGLARDHARLRSATDMLARVAAGEQPLSSGQVAAAARDFVAQLERHLRAEEKLLACRDVQGTVALGGHRHEWYPLTEGSRVDLDALPREQAIAAAVDRLLRMRPGEQVELRSGTDLDPVWREVSELSPGRYRFAVLEDGPPRWRMRVTRRAQAGNSA